MSISVSKNQLRRKNALNFLKKYAKIVFNVLICHVAAPSPHYHFLLDSCLATAYKINNFTLGNSLLISLSALKKIYDTTHFLKYVFQ